MVEEDQKLATVHKPLLPSNSSNSIETLASGTEEFKIRRLTLSNVTLINSKSLNNIRQDDKETTIGINFDRDSYSTATTKGSGASLLGFPFRNALASGSGTRSISTVCAFLTILIAFLTLLYLYIVQTSPAQTQNLQVNEAAVSSNFLLQTSSGQAQALQQEQEFSTWEWKSVSTLASRKTKLHIQVQKPHRSTSQLSGNLQDMRIKAQVDDDTLAISGRPAFCTKKTMDTPRGVTLENVKSLHLTNMDDCSHYMKLILLEWEFPQIHHIKLQNVVVREIEFSALTKFIDRHSATLHKVEITESYLCPSPACDAGMINFPDHDFQVVVTKRKESPEWM